MDYRSLLSNLMGIVIAFAPPQASDQASPIERFASAGIGLAGRDPLDGTGFCGSCLRVSVPSDVVYVSFPLNGYDRSHLAMLSHFPNIKQVRFQRSASAEEYLLIQRSLPKAAVVFCKVRSGDGRIIRFASHAWSEVSLDDELDPATGKVIVRQPERLLSASSAEAVGEGSSLDLELP